MRRGSKTHSVLLSPSTSWIHSASDGFIPVASGAVFSIFNSSHSRDRRENNVMYNFQCVSHLKNAKQHPTMVPSVCGGDTSSCEAETERFYPAESATSPCLASGGGGGETDHMVHGEQKSNLKVRLIAQFRSCIQLSSILANETFSESFPELSCKVKMTDNNLIIG